MKAQRDDYNSKLYNKYRNMLLDLINKLDISYNTIGKVNTDMKDLFQSFLNSFEYAPFHYQNIENIRIIQIFK